MRATPDCLVDDLPKPSKPGEGAHLMGFRALGIVLLAVARGGLGFTDGKLAQFRQAAPD